MQSPRLHQAEHLIMNIYVLLEEIFLTRCKHSGREDRSREVLHALILENVAPGTRILTDSWKAYEGLDTLGYEHAMVNHSKVNRSHVE